MDIASLILKKLCNDEVYARKVLPFIKKDYFEGSHRVAYETILKFITKYNALPSKSTLLIDFANSDANVEANNSAVEILKDSVIDESVDHTWLIENTEKWCKDRALFLAIMKSIEIVDGKDKNLSEGAIPDILQKALSVSFDKSVGHDYVEDFGSRYDFYHNEEEKIPFDLDMMNKITNGGIVNKSLNLILGGTGGGKSLMLCHLAANYLSQGLNVLYVTLEMSEERIAERIDANLFDTDIKDLCGLTKGDFKSRIDSIRSKTSGRLIIKEYPTASAHVGHIRALFNELKLKKNFEADVLIIDYLNIMASERVRGLGGNVNTYSFVKAIAEEVRGLAGQYDIPVWSASQVNRTGMNSSDVDITNISESFGVAATVDLMISIIVTEQLDSLGQIMIKQLKNRYNDLNFHRRFVLGIDRSKMRLFDVEDSAQGNIMPDLNEYSIGKASDGKAMNVDDWDIS